MILLYFVKYLLIIQKYKSFFLEINLITIKINILYVYNFHYNRFDVCIFEPISGYNCIVIKIIFLQ